jgi:tetratricopeptide (TPR) repeat protein
VAAKTSGSKLVLLFKSRPWLGPLLAAAAILLAYASVWHAGFLWDDDAHVFTNPTIIGPLGLREIWTSAKANYFPLTMTSFWLQHKLWGLAPVPYHLVSVLCHVGAALLLWAVLRRLAVPGAWLGALLWALHPVQVESVAWISELKNTQSAVFYLAAIWFFLRWVQGAEKLAVTRDYALAIGAAVLAILSKSSTVMLPVVLGLLAWWLGRRRLREALWLLPFFAVSLAASAWTIWEQKVNSMASGAEWSHGLAARFAIAGKVPWFYLGKLLWPRELIFIYPRWDVEHLSLLDWLPLAAALAVVVLCWRFRGPKLVPLGLALGYFVVSLFPVLGFFDVFFFRYSFVGDHFQYLASMGPLALVGAALAVAVERHLPNDDTTRVFVFGGPLVILGGLTLLQSRIYQTNFALWQDTVARNPAAWIARVNYGAELRLAGRSAEALEQLEAAVRLKPQFVEVEMNIGAALIDLGRAAEAVPHFERALTGQYMKAEIHNGLGAAFLQLGRHDEAVAQFEQALALKPELDSARNNLTSTLLQANRGGEAVERLQAAVRAEPNVASRRVALAGALAATGRNAGAIEEYRAALALSPDDPQAHAALAGLLDRAGQKAEALQHAEQALRGRDDAMCHYIVANDLIAQKRFQDAADHLERAVQLDPNFVAARGNLAGAYYYLGRAADAVPHFEAVARLQPESAAAHSNLAGALTMVGRRDEAIEQYRQALQIEPNSPDTHNNLALALTAAGRVPEAIAECREALRLKPDFQPAQQQLAHLEGLAKQAANK